MNGAKRLGGNSLSDLLVFGSAPARRRAVCRGSATAPRIDEAQTADAAAEMTRYLSGAGDEDPYELHAELKAMMQATSASSARGRAERGGRPGRAAEARGRVGAAGAGSAPSTRAGTSAATCATC